MKGTQSPVLILGARSDIGRAIAHRFAEAGYNLQLAARDHQRLEADVNDYSLRYGVNSQRYEFDALAFDSHAAFYEGLSPKPEIVIYVIGLYPDQAQAEQDWALSRRILETNFVGAASILHHVANEMADKGSGTIIGISSVAGERGRAKNYVYGSAKAGLTAFLSGLRNRLSKNGVHVITVKPGFVYTAMTEGLDLPPKLTSQPEQVAKAVFKAVKRKRHVVYVLSIWRYIMLIIRNIPEGIFKKMKL